MPPKPPMMNTLGTLITPSALVVRQVTIAFGEPMENSYSTGKPDGNRAARSEPEMMVVAKLRSFKGAALPDSGTALPFASQALMLIETPPAGSA